MLKRRTSNWTFQEKKFLIEQVKLYAKDIENKTLNCQSNFKKDEAWQAISNAFKDCGLQRDKKMVKDQWKRMKLACRKQQKNLVNDSVLNNEDDFSYEIQKILPIDVQTDDSNNDTDKISRPVVPKRRNNTAKPDLTLYEEKCLALYEKKIKQQLKHDTELHNLRMKWEEKIFKLKHEMISRKLKIKEDSEFLD